MIASISRTACSILAAALAVNSAAADNAGVIIAAPAKFKTENAPVIAASFSGPGRDAWWTVFHDGALSRLEEQALTANQDLRQAIARVDQARAEARVAAADFFPSVTAPLQAARLRTTNTGPVIGSRLVGNNSLFPSLGGGGPISFDGQALSATYDDYQAQVSLSYEVDVFGRIRHMYGEAAANARASAADRAAVELGLASQVAADYFALRAVDSEIAILQRTGHLRADSVQIQQERVNAGSANTIDLSRAQLEQANTEADLSDALQQRAESENALAVLCGQSPSSFHLAPQPLDAAHPPALPVAIPAQLLTQRPDLIEARQRLLATTEGIDAARAKLLPTFIIGANYGYESAQFGQLLENQSREWSITGGVSIPIFEGGRNVANLKSARARRDEAVAAYQQTALTAFEEAENALSALRQRATQADARSRAAESARRVVDASQKSYEAGSIDYFEVIDSQRSLLDAEVLQVQTLNARYAATIDLIRAMGGGFAGGG